VNGAGTDSGSAEVRRAEKATVSESEYDKSAYGREAITPGPESGFGGIPGVPRESYNEEEESGEFLDSRSKSGLSYSESKTGDLGAPPYKQSESKPTAPYNKQSVSIPRRPLVEPRPL
jgi:hypothetical protein